MIPQSIKRAQERGQVETLVRALGGNGRKGSVPFERQASGGRAKIFPSWPRGGET